MQRLFTAVDLPEAYLVANLLQRAGIEVEIRNEYAQGGLGEIPFLHAFPEIWVADNDDFERGQALVTAYESGHGTDAITHCHYCGEENPGNFDNCWKCGALLVKE